MTPTSAAKVRGIGAIIPIGVFLNHSQVVVGLNISFADVFLVTAILTMLFRGRRDVPMAALGLFLALSISTIFTAAFVTPQVFGVTASLETILREWSKLAVLALYLFLGFNVNEREGATLYKAFSITAIMLAVVGIAFWVLDISLMRETLFFSERFRGFMNDPNYFSLILVCALPWLIRSNEVRASVKWVGSFIVFFGVAQSGSKTGMLTLIAYLTILLIGHVVRSTKSMRQLVPLIAETMVAILLIAIGSSKIGRLIEAFAETSSSAERISLIFTDFGAALTEGGSGRDLAWETAAQIWERSPFVGIGVGPYGEVAASLSGIPIIAHNTYIQLAVEWGSLWAIAFVVLTIRVMAASSSHIRGSVQAVSRDVVLILLAGSFAISLNNVRLLWIALGYLTYSLIEAKSRAGTAVETEATILV